MAWQARALEAVEQAIFVVDLASIIRYCNRFAAQLLSWPAEDIQGRPIYTFISHWAPDGA